METTETHIPTMECTTVPKNRLTKTKPLYNLGVTKDNEETCSTWTASEILKLPIIQTCHTKHPLEFILTSLIRTLKIEVKPFLFA